MNTKFKLLKEWNIKYGLDINSLLKYQVIKYYQTKIIGFIKRIIYFEGKEFYEEISKDILKQERERIIKNMLPMFNDKFPLDKLRLYLGKELKKK